MTDKDWYFHARLTRLARATAATNSRIEANRRGYCILQPDTKLPVFGLYAQTVSDLPAKSLYHYYYYSLRIVS